MKIVAIYSSQFERLRDEWFLATLPPDMEPILVQSPYDSAPGIEFQTPNYRATLDFKLEVICDTIRRHPGEIICFSDLDVQFFGSFSHVILESIRGHDVAGMRESPAGELNGGFYAIRCAPHVEALWEEVSYADKSETTYYDQDGLNTFLADGSHAVKLAMLPDLFWASHRFLHMKQPEPAEILVNHATGWMDKVEELQRVRAKFASRNHGPLRRPGLR